MSMSWTECTLDINGKKVSAVAPEIISVSRSTDIPAFYARQFMQNLHDGWMEWINPFSMKKSYISFKRAGAIIFWSKNPAPLMEYQDELDSYGFTYYFQFTLNDYEKELFELNVPPLADRIKTFRKLSDSIGRDRVIWRFDPIMVGHGITPEIIIQRIENIGEQIKNYTAKLVFSFVDIENYRKVRATLKKLGIFIREPTREEMHKIAAAIGRMTAKWGISAATCGEKEDFKKYGIEKNKCVDDELLIRLCTAENKNLSAFLQKYTPKQLSLLEAPKPKIPRDRGQREECRCVISKAVGRYDTCHHLCVYCYANSSATTIRRYLERIKEKPKF